MELLLSVVFDGSPMTFFFKISPRESLVGTFFSREVFGYFTKTMTKLFVLMAYSEGYIDVGDG